MSRELLEKLETIEDLPTMPQTAKKVLDILNKPDFSFAELVSVISKDMNITASILRLANSALYSPRNEIKNLTQALSFLGANNIKNLVVALSTKALFENFKASLLIHKVWEHSVAVAIYARIISLKTNNKVSEETFLIGMLHDIGVIIMNQYIDNYEIMISEIYGSNESLYEKEKELFGLTHSEVGAKLAEIWNLPDIYSDSILHHHNYTESAHKDYCMFIDYADNIISRKGINVVSFFDEDKIEEIEKLLNIDEETELEIENIFEDIYESEKELFALK
ncbi:HDOD domain-containing protein [Deferribacter autotrophicus]|uniref:HDOD domain-containing protein n=1 Tax=Deferribacter autotrophicus TaxID=500465 RepID=A0A5A8F7H7_9BACT|nr:HDOD domain-containing protein [Deferribacter autotrophicus]KAA0257806.1 HDOD domain-containing protein [Deferribacter autotrophicus]